MNTLKKDLPMQDDLKEGIGKELEIYTSRFSDEQEKLRDVTWDVLVEDFFSKYIKPEDVILDIGAGDGLFLKKIKANKKIAVDLSSHVRELEKFGIAVYQIPATKMQGVVKEVPSVIVMSNFLEHLPDKKILLEVIQECYNILPVGGRVMILQPNIRYAGAKYWDYVDHHIALTEFSLAEALTISGFRIEKLIPQFLPYSAKSSVGSIGSLLPSRLVVKMYLRFPILWKLFGAQTFVIAIKK